MSDARPSGSFTASAWREIAGWRDAVAGMPFIRALADGSLAADAFGFYLAQDAAYLVEFARACRSLVTWRRHGPARRSLPVPRIRR